MNVNLSLIVSALLGDALAGAHPSPVLDPAFGGHGAPIVTLPGSTRSGLQVVRDGVAAYVTAKGYPIDVAEVGLKYRSFALNQGPTGGNRIVFIPGEFDGNLVLKARKYGTINRETRNSGSAFNPRELASWERPFTVSVWAGPVPGQGDKEGGNLTQAENLLEILLRALYSITAPDGTAIAASLHFGDVMVNSPPSDNAYGAELLFQVVQIAPFFDEAYEYVQAKITNATSLT